MIDEFANHRIVETIDFRIADAVAARDFLQGVRPATQETLILQKGLSDMVVWLEAVKGEALRGGY